MFLRNMMLCVFCEFDHFRSDLFALVIGIGDVDETTDDSIGHRLVFCKRQLKKRLQEWMKIDSCIEDFARKSDNDLI